MPDRVKGALIGWLLLLPAALLYTASFHGITSSNDGSHYALLRAIVDTRSAVIDPYERFTEDVDISAHGGHFFSDRPPGTALIAAPAYLLGRVLPALSTPVPSRWDAGNEALFWLLLAPAAAVWTTARLFFRIQLALGVRRSFAIAGATTLLLGTTLWKYGTALFSHAFSGCLVLATVHQLMTVRDWNARNGLRVGLLLGAATAVEYQNAALIPIALLWLIAFTRLRRVSLFVGVAAGLCSVLIPLLVYFKTCFGGWFLTSYSARIQDPWSRQFATTFAGDVGDGLLGLVFWRTHQSTGWFLRMPVLALGLAGYAIALRKEYRVLLLPLVVVTFFTVLFATHKTYHTNTGDCRYISPYIPLALLPVPLVLETMWSRSPRLRLPFLILLAVLALWGTTGTVSVLAHSYGSAAPIVPYPFTTFWRHPLHELRLALANVHSVFVVAACYIAAAAAHLSTLAARRT